MDLSIGKSVQHSSSGSILETQEKNLGRQSLLQDVDQALLWQLVQQPAPERGLWNARKVPGLTENMGFLVSRQRGWQYLQQIGFGLKTPGLSHSDSSFSQQLPQKKNSLKNEQSFKVSTHKQTTEVWCQDEQRLGLKPKIRRVWTPAGEQPIASVKTQYQWLWLYGFVHPESGETYFWILLRFNTELFGVVLADLALLI